MLSTQYRLDLFIFRTVLKEFTISLNLKVSKGNGSVVKKKKNTPHAEDMGSIPASVRSPGGGNGNPLQFSCLGNPMDREAWQAIVQRVAKSQTQLSTHTQRQITKTLNIYIHIYIYIYINDLALRKEARLTQNKLSQIEPKHSQLILLFLLVPMRERATP